MKKYTLIILCVLMSFGCGKKSNKSNQTAKPSTSQKTVNQGLEEALIEIIQLCKEGKVKELKELTTGSGKQLMWIPEDENDKPQIIKMKEFGGFLEETEYKWNYYNNDRTKPIASFGPTHKAYNLYFIKVNDRWLLDQLIGGD